MSKSNLIRKTSAIVLSLATLALPATSAFAVSSAVKRACIGDYLSYCSQHEVGSKGVRQCFRRNGTKLSKTCVNALVTAGMVSKQEVSRRAAKR